MHPIDDAIKREDFLELFIEKFRKGFYNWGGIKYFLFEYELSLHEKSKTSKSKIDWNQFCKEKEDFVSIEHIYPQTAKAECWKTHFSQFSSEEKRILRDSLGNLVPLSKPKNSSLQNKCFVDKVDNNVNSIGYRYGSYSENEISKLSNWDANNILERGIKLLSFMEKRWNLPLGDNSSKIGILNLKFLQPNPVQSTVSQLKKIRKSSKK